jgi:hypothetical protein
MVKCANAVKNSLLQAGADKAEYISDRGPPVVVGEKILIHPTYCFSIWSLMMTTPEPLELWKCALLNLLLKMEKFMQEVLVMIKDSFICM